MDLTLNNAVMGVELSGIRQFTYLVRDTPGACALTIGEPDLNTPDIIKEAAKAALDADQHADDLGNHRARAEKRRQQREGADQRQRHQAERVAGERGEAVGNPVAEAGGHDDADQRRDERHKRQNGF